MTRTMKIVVAAIVVLVLALALAVPANAMPDWEEGAEFDEVNHVCTQDGVQGITTADRQCMTPADYDEAFSYEVLSTTSAAGGIGVTDPETTIAEVYDIAPPEEDPTPPSERELGKGLTSELFSFISWVGEVWHRVVGGWLIQ